jgi:hypothetical protein|tara:strand:+ start:332 stop:616 length:285 start_codon:yes stop_codon:yes gene_type:complete
MKRLDLHEKLLIRNKEYKIKKIIHFGKTEYFIEKIDNRNDVEIDSDIMDESKIKTKTTIVKFFDSKTEKELFSTFFERTNKDLKNLQKYILNNY